MGRISGYSSRMKEGWEVDDEVADIAPRIEKVNNFVQQWWERWLLTAFLLLCPRSKWRV